MGTPAKHFWIIEASMMPGREGGVETGSASFAQVRPSLPETGFHTSGVGNVADAQAKRVRRAGGPLLSRAAVLLRERRTGH